MDGKDFDKIFEMKNGEHKYYNWHEEGGAEIWKINGLWFLFEVPLYGGKPRYIKEYKEDEIGIMIDEYKSWT